MFQRVCKLYWIHLTHIVYPINTGQIQKSDLTKTIDHKPGGPVLLGDDSRITSEDSGIDCVLCADGSAIPNSGGGKQWNTFVAWNRYDIVVVSIL